jgi:1-acyl-sn-glycerol-3-phosphate acyltransferase
MLTARKNPILSRLIYRLLMKPALQSNFHRVQIREAKPMSPSQADLTPVIIFGNHSAWWDGHLTMAANEERWRRDGYVMVEETQLARYQFFRYCGGFSVNRHDGRSAMQSVNYAADVLTNGPNRLLLIFPQGEIQANDIRPLHFFQGVGHIVRKVLAKAPSCRLYPMGLRYEFIGEQKPDAFISLGAPIQVESSQPWETRLITSRLEEALTRELDCLRDDVVAYRLSSFSPLVTGASSINRIWDAVRGKAEIKRVGDG